jgi:hypothetical protein
MAGISSLQCFEASLQMLRGKAAMLARTASRTCQMAAKP